MWSNGLSLGFFLLLNVGQGMPDAVARFNNGFRVNWIDSVVEKNFAFADHLPDRSLSVCFDSLRHPIAVFRKVVTEVCSKGECLPVFLKLFWTPAGQYLGFEMEPNEILTKYDHADFSPGDYDRLHRLLNDRLSVLGNIAESDIVPDSGRVTLVNGSEPDIVSGATKKDIVPYIVAGAAYTTYTLWHLVYGDSRDSVRRAVEPFVTPELLVKYLGSPLLPDKVWALSWGEVIRTYEPELRKELDYNYANGDDYLRNRILDAVCRTEALNAGTAPLLVAFFAQSGLSQKRSILLAAERSPNLGRHIIPELATVISLEQSQLILVMLRIVRKQVLKEDEMIQQVQSLTHHHDPVVATAAVGCLEVLKRE